MNIFHLNKNKCEKCNEKFSKYDDLIAHAKQTHHHVIVKCNKCGKEFIHAKDRLHHTRDEHK